MKKRLLICLLAGALLLITGCDTSSSTPNAGQPASTQDDTYFLTQRIWERSVVNCDLVDKCVEVLYFSTSGKCCYYEGCGKMIGESASYKSYTYDAATGIITIYEEDMTTKVGEMKVVRFDEDKIFLQMNSGAKEFYFEGSYPNVTEECRDYMEGYSIYLTVVSMIGDKVTIGTTHYDKNNPNAEELVEEKLASNAQFFMLDIHTALKGNDETSTHTYYEITKDEMGQVLSSDPTFAFVWYNDNLEIEKIVCYKVTKTWV